MQTNSTRAAATGSKTLTDTASAFAQIEDGQTLAKRIGEGYGVDGDVAGEVGQFVTGFNTGFELAEQASEVGRTLNELPNSIGGKGIPKRDNVTGANDELIQGALKANERFAKVLNGNPIKTLGAKGRKLVKVDNAKLFKNNLKLRTQNQFNPIHPGQTLASSKNYSIPSNNTKPGSLREMLTNVIDELRGGSPPNFEEISCNYCNYNLTGNSNYSLTINSEQLELQSQVEILNTILKFKKRIIAVIIISGLVYTAFTRRGSLKKFLTKFIKFYKKFAYKWYKFSNKKVFNNLITKTIKRLFYVDYHLNKAAYLS